MRIRWNSSAKRCEKLRLWNAWVLKRLTLKTNQVLYIRTIGKLAGKHLRNWPDPWLCRFKSNLLCKTFLLRRQSQGTMHIQDHRKSCFFKFHHSGVQRSLQAWFKGVQSQLQVLASSIWCQFFRHAKSKSCGIIRGSHPDFWRRPWRPDKNCDRVVVSSRRSLGTMLEAMRVNPELQ